MILEKYTKRVIEWAGKNGILKHGSIMIEAYKTIEEAYEVKDAILHGTKNEIKTELGDVFVTIIIQAYLHGWKIEECLKTAVEKIEKRTGKMINGEFVRNKNEM